MSMTEGGKRALVMGGRKMVNGLLTTFRYLRMPCMKASAISSGSRPGWKNGVCMPNMPVLIRQGQMIVVFT